MQSEIMKRAMFSMPLSKAARNTGIMAGFEDEMPPEDTVEEMPPMARTPQNPEILMNNLRGDVRSTDARYQELIDMVGEEAAMNTPPEVLAMLQMQLGQQGGIGGLPQGAAMMPPPMEGGGPMGAPGGAPAMPSPQDMQGGMPPQGAMPPGMEGAPPFPQGADGAPPTPDGMPPMHAAGGAWATAATRAAELVSPYVSRFGEVIGEGATAANNYLGKLMSQNAPTTFRPVFENIRGPGGRYTAEQIVNFPSATQHLRNVYPKTSRAALEAADYLKNTSKGSMGALGGATAAGVYLNSKTPVPTDADMRQGLENQFLDAYYASNGGDRSIPPPSLDGMTNEQLVDATIQLGKVAADKYEPMRTEKAPALPSDTTAATDFSKMVPSAQSMEGVDKQAAEGTTPAVGNADDPLGLFIDQKLKEQAAREKAYAGSYAGRVEAQQKAIQPLYDKINEGSTEDARMNAMLLLADAGFKYASTTAATPAMAFAQAVQGIPKGLAAIVAQARDRKVKIDMAVLEHAMTRVDTEDKYARDLQKEMFAYARAIDVENIRQMQKQGIKFEQYPGGMLKKSDRVSGTFLGLQIDPDSPLYISAKDTDSPYALVPTNPFVQDMGTRKQAIVEDADQRKQVESHFHATNNALEAFDDVIRQVQKGYGPGSAILSGWNNTFVPFGAPLSKDTARAEAAIGVALERLKRNIGSSDLTGSGKQSVQEMAEAKSVLDLKPSAFFSSPAEAAQKINAFKTMLLNMRQGDIEKLGFADRSYRATVPPTGQSTDPFVIPADKQEAAYMLRHLSQNLAGIVDPDTAIYLKYPNGQVKPVRPAFLSKLATSIGAQ